MSRGNGRYTEPDQFEQLYKKYNKLLLRKAWEILRDDMLAEDAASSAWMRIYRNLHKIDSPDSPRGVAFMVTVARNRALSLARKKSGAETFAPEENQPDAFNLEDSMIDQLSAEHILEMVGSLDEELRNIFILKYAYGFSHREIASQLGITENSFNVRLHRARKVLFERIKSEEVAYEK